MQDPEPFDPSERELTDALRGLELAPVRTSPQQVWYRAGFEAGRRGANAWRGAAAVAAVALVCSLLVPVGRRAARDPVERVVYVREGPVQVPQPATAAPGPSADHSQSYLRLRQQLVQRGLDGLPPVPPGDGGGAGPGGWSPSPGGVLRDLDSWDFTETRG